MSHNCAYPAGFDTGMFGAVGAGKEVAVEFFNRWVDEVKATVPNDRLLIHNAKDGWDPLCKFLGVPVPENAYPRVNDTQHKRDSMNSFKRIGLGMFVVTPLLLTSGCIAYWFLKK